MALKHIWKETDALALGFALLGLVFLVGDLLFSATGSPERTIALDMALISAGAGIWFWPRWVEDGSMTRIRAANANGPAWKPPLPNWRVDVPVRVRRARTGARGTPLHRSRDPDVPWSAAHLESVIGQRAGHDGVGWVATTE